MPQPPSNIVLIGMPGAGKSTVGVILAKLAALQFVDTDLLIQTGKKKSLQDIVDNEGYLALRQAEEQVLLGLKLSNCVIATGGSAVYSQPAMTLLKADGLVVFLDLPLAVLETRIRDYSTRGLAKPPEQSFTDMFQERRPLYARYADITITPAGLTQEKVCGQIMAQVRLRLSGFLPRQR